MKLPMFHADWKNEQDHHSGEKCAQSAILVLPSGQGILASDHKQSGHKSPVSRDFNRDGIGSRAVPGKCDSCNFRAYLQCDNYHTRNATNPFNISF